MEQQAKSAAPIPIMPPSRFEALREAETITSNDLMNASTTELYAVVVEHWSKCTPCAKRELLESCCRPIRDNARVMQKYFDTAQAILERKA